MLRILGPRPANKAEQDALAAWSSWGAVPQVFDPGNDAFAAERDELHALLTQQEWNAAARTTVNAHYTDPEIVHAMWQALDALGFEQGRVLEPGCGSGNFIGHAPVAVQVTGIELDPVTAALAQKLYPSATIRVESFADTRGLGGFDATIGNVPFADVHLHDGAYNPGRHSIHNHFIIKSLGMTNPGGLVAVLTSRYTLDSQSTAAREEMARRGDLVAAYRLPSGAHQRVAGTDAVTDLVIFRRHLSPPPVDAERPDWVDTQIIDVAGHPARVNATFVTHPNRVLGTLSTENTQYASDALTVAADGDLPSRLRGAVEQLRRTAAQPGADIGWVRYQGEPVAQVGDRPDRFMGHIRPDGRGGYEQSTAGGDWAPFSVPATQTAEFGHLLELRDRYVALIEADAESSIDTAVNIELRAGLNESYDGYVSRYGPINRFSEQTTRRTDEDGHAVLSRRQPGAVALFRRDPHAAYVKALELFDDDTQQATKADILRHRVLVAREPRTSAATPADALAIALDTYGEVRADQIARLLNIDPAQARGTLGGLVFEEPETDRLVPAAEYLSGPVRKKLADARLAAQADNRFSGNVEALRQVQPVDLQPGEIRASLGATWIPAGDVQEFLRDTLNETRLKVGQDPVTGWKVTGGNRQTVQAIEEWGTYRMPAHKIAQYMLNQQPIRVTDETADGNRIPNPQASAAAREKGMALNERFSTWVWESPQRSARLARDYNDLFNGTVLRRTYTAGPMELPGLAMSFKPAPHQLNAVARAITEPSTGIFHPVGYGKTAIMVISMMEQKRLGLVNKPAMVVPNHMLEQAQRELLQLYPAAKIIAATSDDLTRENRRAFVARITNGSWDAVVMTRTAFAQLPVSAEELKRYLDAEITPMRDAFEAQLAAGNPDSRSVKQAQKAMMQQEERIKAKLDSRRDAGVSFEQTGIDYLCIDELQDFKNLTTPSKIPGAGITNGAQRATDLHQKEEYLRREHGGRAILGATATPISNSVSEVYVMLRHLRPELLTDAGITTFDEWAANFGQTVTNIELAPAGQTFREATRFARFQNVPELLTMWNTAGDAVAKDAVALKRPNLVARDDGQRLPEPVHVPASDELMELTAQLSERARLIKQTTVDPAEDNMLKITSEGRHAALDLRLTPQYRDDDNLGLTVPTKVEVAAARIATIHSAHKDHTYLDASGEPHPRTGALQLVFCDLGTPKGGDRYDVYTDLRAQLVDHGIPAEQIAFTHSARNDTEKGRLFERARTGDVQVLIGSTQMMGVGTNVQTRAIALHHLDCPWKPSEMEQREGRIIRQGNQNSEVAICRYATEKSFDGYMYQTVARKGAFIDQVMNGSVDVREIDDISSSETISYEEMQVAISGNPFLREKHQIDADIARLDMLARSHRDAARTLTYTIRDSDRTLEHLQAQLPEIQSALEQTVDTRGDKFSITVGLAHYRERTAAAPALARELEQVLHGGPYAGPREVGQLGGCRLLAEKPQQFYRDEPTVQVTASDHTKPVIYTKSEIAHPSGSHIVRLENAIHSLPTRLAETKARIEEITDQRDRAQARVGSPFPHQEQLDHLRVRQQEVAAQIRALAAPEQSTTDEVPNDSTRKTADELDRTPTTQPDHLTGRPTKTVTTQPGQTNDQVYKNLAAIAEHLQQDGPCETDADTPPGLTQQLGQHHSLS